MRIRSETSRRTVGDGDIFVAHIVRCGNPKPQFDRAVGDGDITSMFRAHVGLNYAAVFNGSVFAGTLPPTVGTVGYKYIVGFADSALIIELLLLEMGLRLDRVI